MEIEGRSLLDIIFSWSIDDILNKDLYKFKVKQIPQTFSSITNYLGSFMYPLVEEMHADLYSSLTTLPQAPICEISCVEISEDYKPPNNLICIIYMKATDYLEYKFDAYEPESGDLIALTDVRLKCLADIKDPKVYVMALVQQVTLDAKNDEYKLKVQLSKPIASEVHDIQKGWVNFAVFLTNLTTNIRIWKALNLDLGEGTSFNIFSSVLQKDPSVSSNCDTCFFREINWIESTTSGALIRSLDLNESQEQVVRNCTALKECYHKSTVKLVWGPPGTGKTKTVASLLFVLLKMKCRVVTCAPTNVAVIEIIKRLLKIASRSFEYGSYGLGDIVLYGNGKRMKIDDHAELFDVFLDFRAHVLNKCFQPSSGWVHCLDSLICLIENPGQQYHMYLRDESIKDDNYDGDDEQLDESNGQDKEVPKISEKFKRKTWRKIIEETIRGGAANKKHPKKIGRQEKKASELDQSDKKRLTFEEFVEREFHCLMNKLKFYVPALYTHLPTSFISLKDVKSMINALNLLDNLCSVLSCIIVPNNELDVIKIECLQALKALRSRFHVPDIHGIYCIKKFCLQNGNLFFCTASGSAKLHVDGPRRLNIVIIDEAAQLKECESAITLQLPGLRHAILIGDEQQLPAMVKSKISEKAEFGRSLFERLVLLENQRHLLNVQYRMHPLISLFPNKEFYQNKISDAPSVVDKCYQKKILAGKLFCTYSFIDVSCGEEVVDDAHSLQNRVEVAVVCEILCRIYREVSASRQRLTIGIISPYKAQVNAIEQKVKETNISGDNGGIMVKVRSVDGFQGGEEDVIIISTVRCNSYGLVGFLTDLRRTNVALTRARYCLWIIGNGRTLDVSDSVWRNIVIDAKSRGCFFDAQEDEGLAQAMYLSLLELGQIENLLDINSVLFRRSRWKVLFGDAFRQSLVRIEKGSTRKQVLLLLSRIATGWRKSNEERYLSFKNGIPQLLEYIKVDELLCLIWNVDIIEENARYVQILKVWDVLPWFEIPKLAISLNSFFSTYSMERLNYCKFRCYEGNLEVPMTWSVDTFTRRDNLSEQDLMEQLSRNFSSLNLME